MFPEQHCSAVCYLNTLFFSFVLSCSECNFWCILKFLVASIKQFYQYPEGCTEDKQYVSRLLSHISSIWKRSYFTLIKHLYFRYTQSSRPVNCSIYYNGKVSLFLCAIFQKLKKSCHPVDSVDSIQPWHNRAQYWLVTVLSLISSRNLIALSAGPVSILNWTIYFYLRRP